MKSNHRSSIPPAPVLFLVIFIIIPICDVCGFLPSLQEQQQQYQHQRQGVPCIRIFAEKSLNVVDISSSTQRIQQRQQPIPVRRFTRSFGWRIQSTKKDNNENTSTTFVAAMDSNNDNSIDKTIDENDNDDEGATTNTLLIATTGTVNERLLAELESAKNIEKYGARSDYSLQGKRQRRFGLEKFRESRKTEKERIDSLEDARNLNGINPLSAFAGATVAIGCTVLLWNGITYIAEYYTTNPIDTVSDTYFVQRVTIVVRNVIIGIVALATGYFGVTGVGLFALAVRVTYGVITGELDPTPIIKSNNQQSESDNKQIVNMSNMIDLMLNKKPGRKR